MAYYVVDGDHLTDIADAIRAKGATSALLEFPTDFVPAIQDLPTGIIPIHSQQVTANTTSTSNTTRATITKEMDENFDPTLYIMYISIVDTLGKRSGRFYLSETFVCDPVNSTGSGRTVGQCWRINSNGSVGGYPQSLASGYGVYCSAANYNASTKTYTLTISARYDSTYSLTINSTYDVEVYLIPLVRFFE